MPWCLGYFIVRLIYKKKTISTIFICIGYGYFLGLFVLSVLMYLCKDTTVTMHQLMIIIIFINIFLLIRYLKNNSSIIKAKEFLEYIAEIKITIKIVLAFCVFWILVRIISFSVEVILQPLFPWDAYTAWMPKAHYWFHSERLSQIISYWDWIGDYKQIKEIYVHDSADEHSLVNFVIFWIALMIGSWDEGYILLPWLLVTIAFLFGFAGQAIEYGVNIKIIIVSMILLISLPVMNSHIALPGYVDIWLGFILGLTVLSLIQWCVNGGFEQLLMTFIMIFGLCLIKSESGVVWSLVVFFSVCLAFINVSSKFILSVIFLCCLMFVCLMIIGLEIGDMKSIHHLVIKKDLIKIPYLFNSHLESMSKLYLKLKIVLDHLFMMGSWNIFWALLLFVASMNINLILKNIPPAIVFFILISNLIILTYIFLVNYYSVSLDTIVNRAFLHVVPAYIGIVCFSINKPISHELLR